MTARFHILAFGCLLFALDSARPSFAAQSVTLDDVIQVVNAGFPLIESTQKDVESARAEVRASEGSFDIQWKTRVGYSLLGFYENERLDSIIEQPTTLWGTTFFGGYRLGTGKFPDYEGKQVTNPGGEARLGLSIPFLRDGFIDRRRANIQRSNLGVDIASLQVVQQRLESIRTATHRYWDWVAAGKRLGIFRTLLKIAEDRDRGLAERVKHGDLPDFERRDNQRAILQRRSQLVSAERSFQQASFELSLYYRNAENEPVILPEERLPASIPEPNSSEVPKTEIKDALIKRPDLVRFTAIRSQNEVERTLAINQAGPKLDVQLQAVRSLRDGDVRRNGTQLEAGVLLEIPLQANVAGGREDSAVAVAGRLELQERFLRDRIGAEIRDARSALDTALLRVEVIRQELDLAKKMEQGERVRFNHGDSNLLFLNIREQATVDTAVRELEAIADYRKSLATLRAALGELD